MPRMRALLRACRIKISCIMKKQSPMRKNMDIFRILILARISIPHQNDRFAALLFDRKLSDEKIFKMVAVLPGGKSILERQINFMVKETHHQNVSGILLGTFVFVCETFWKI